MTLSETGTVLDKILARTAADLVKRKAKTPVSALEEAARRQTPPLSLASRLKGPGISVIAEIKRASPSRGVFPVVVEPRLVATDYIAGGAAAISVLTDEPFFQGSLKDLEDAAAVAHAPGVAVPILRKDFIIDPYQVVQARASGADAVLLIVTALSSASLGELLAATHHWRMDALVEVHDEDELERAVLVGARVIGINNRDLKTFAVDLAVTERLAPLTPEDAAIVAESGVFGPSEVERLRRAGADAVLVGEGLIMARDRAGAVRALRMGNGGGG